MVWRLPDRLLALIDSGFWPTDWQAVNRQNLKPLVLKTRVRDWAPEEDVICFDMPPFQTIEERIKNGEEFWKRTEAHLDGISSMHTLVIGDFGLGSDAPIVLDYSDDPDKPCVKRLKWGDSFDKNHWIVAAESFDAMCDSLGMPNFS